MIQKRFYNTETIALFIAEIQEVSLEPTLTSMQLKKLTLF